MTHRLTLTTAPVPRVPGYVRATIIIQPEEAVHPLDVGETTHCCIHPDTLQEELDFYLEQGYQIK